MQVPLSAASLNTNDCFVLVTKGETYVWMGKGSTGDERETAKNLASQSDRDPVVVYEGDEWWIISSSSVDQGFQIPRRTR